MSLAGLLLVLAAAVCHATWNLFVKMAGGGPIFLWLFSFIASLIYLPFAIYVLLFNRPDFDPVQILFILGSVLLHLGYFSLLQAGYRRGDLSVVYPTARATGPLLSTAFALLFLGESLSWQLALGGLILVFGVSLRLLCLIFCLLLFFVKIRFHCRLVFCCTLASGRFFITARTII